MEQNSTTTGSDVAPTVSDFREDPDQEKFSLPIYRCINPRSIIQPEQINLNEIALKCKENSIRKQNRRRSDHHPYPDPKIALPRYPLTLMWNPEVINFVLQHDPVVNRLRLFNSCIRPIYIQIYGLWCQNARLGASWCCRPRTRILLAPGMSSYLAITATPRVESPIPMARIGLQLSATHMRDSVVGYFLVPMEVKFLNYVSINCTQSTTDLSHVDGHQDKSKGTLLVVTETDDSSTFNK